MTDADPPPDDRDPGQEGNSDLPEAGAKPDESPRPKRLGDFEILRELGRGGMGVVYDARQVSLNRRVALKVLPPGLGLTDIAVQRFEREARAAAKLHHTNIVPVFAIGEEDGSHYYAMELVEGQPLSRVLNDLRGQGSNPLMESAVTRTAAAGPAKAKVEAASPTTGSTTSVSDASSSGREWFDTVARLLADVADALHYAHGRGVIHRDVKPANLMLSNDGRLCLTDFGLARVAQEPGMTVSGSFLGTPAYMSPEQIAVGRMKLDHRTDIYSLGAVLYELLAHRRPFPGESREEILGGILTKDPRPPRRFNPRIPLDLETICQKAMEKDPDRRYQSAAEFASDLRQYLQRGLIAARRAGLARRTWKSIRRHPAAATVVVAMLIVVTVMGIAWRTSIQKAEQTFQRALAAAQYSMSLGEYPEALRQAESALVINAGAPEARLIRARALIRLQRIYEAAGEARALLEENPDDWIAHMIIVVAARGGSGLRPTRVRGIDVQLHVEAVENLAPDTAEANFLRALVAESDTEAMRLLDRALDIDPGLTEALQARIYTNIELKDFRAALADADRLVTAKPRSGTGRRHRALCYFWIHDGDRALAEVNRAIELDPDDPWNYYTRARLHRYFFRDADTAIEDVSRAIEMDPGNASFFFDRADYHHTAGRYREALADGQRAHELNPEIPRFLGVQALAYLRLGEPDRAYEVFERIDGIVRDWADPEARADVYRTRARTLAEFGDVAGALAAAEHAVELAPEEWRNYLARARLRAWQGDDSGSSADCDRAAGIELREPEDLFYRAGALSRVCDRKDLAIENYSRTIEFAPGWADAYVGRAIEHVYRGDFKRALPDLDRCVRHADTWPTCYYNRLLVYTRLGRFEEALRDSDRLIELTPRSDDAYRLRAEVLVALGRVDDAIAAHDRALSVASSEAVALAARAEILLLKDRHCERVAEDVRRALELDPENPEVGSAVAFVHLFGFYYSCLELYDLDSALERARRAVELDPNNEVARSLLGAALLRAGRFEEAIEHQERAAAAYAGGAFDTFLLAMEHWQLGRRGQALEYYDDAVAWMDEHSPDDPRLILLRAEATELMGV